MKASIGEGKNHSSSEITIGNGGFGNHLNNDRYKTNSYVGNSRKITEDSVGRNDHRKFKSDDLSRDKLGPDQKFLSPSSRTNPTSGDGHGPQDVPGDKRYIIPPSPPRFKDYGSFEGSGGSEIEELRAIRYNLLKNRLQLTTSSSYPTESPYWKAWYMSRMNPFMNPFFSDPNYPKDVSPIHDDTNKKDNSNIKNKDTIPSTTDHPSKKGQVTKHFDAAEVKKNSTIPSAYNKLLQDLFDRITAMRTRQTTEKPKTPSKGINATAVQLKILSALAKQGAFFGPMGQTSIDAWGQTTKRPGALSSTTQKAKTEITTSPTTKATTKSTKATTTKTATTKGTSKATTVTSATTKAITTATTKGTTSSTVPSTTIQKTTQKSTTSRRLHKHKHTKKRGKKRTAHRSHHKHTKHHSEKFHKVDEQDLPPATGDSSDRLSWPEIDSGSGSGSGSGESGSGESEETGSHYKKSYGYIGLRERIKQLKNNQRHHKKMHSHHGRKKHHDSKKDSHETSGKIRTVIPRKPHLRRTKKRSHKTKNHKEGDDDEESEEKHKQKNKHRKNNSKHKFLKIIQRKLLRVKKKNQIASRLKHVQSKMKEIVRRKHKKKNSHVHANHKRNEINKRIKSDVKVLERPIKRKEEPKHWRKGHLLLKKCVTLKEFDHSHYIGVTKLWKNGQKNTFALTECRKKSKHHHHYQCRRTYYRTRGHMGLKSGRKEKKRKLLLMACVKEEDLRKTLVDSAEVEKKSSIIYSKEKKKQKHHKKHIHHHKKHESKKGHKNHRASKRNGITQHRRRKSHLERKKKHHHSKKHHRSKRHHKNHKKKSSSRKHHKSFWSNKDDGDNNDDDDEDESGSGSGEEYSGDEEERVERSTAMTDTKHLRRHRIEKHSHRHHGHHKHGLKHNKTNTNTDSAIHKNNDSQIFTEFVDLMKEMKQEIQNVSVLSSKSIDTKIPAIYNNASSITVNRTQNHSIAENAVRTSDAAKNVTVDSKKMNNTISSGTIQDMVAQIVPAIMKQFQGNTLAVPTRAGDKKTTTEQSTTKETTTKTATTAKMTSTTTISTTVATTKSTTKAATTVKTTTKPRPTAHPFSHRPTTLKHKTVTHHHSTRKKSMPHPKTTAAPNLALILKGLKALGLTQIGQHVTTGKPTQAEKKAKAPSMSIQKKSTTPRVPSAVLKPQPLPPPIPTPLQLHNQFMMNILCFGDSLTAGYHNHGKAFAPYGNHLRQLMMYSSRVPVSVKIKGIVGEMTHKQMVGRLPEILGNNTAFDWVIILGGTNDILHVKNFADDQEFLGQLESVWQPRITKDIEKLHRIAHDHGAHTMLLTIPENAIEAWPGYKILMSMRTKINNALRQFANQNRNKVALCDIAKKLPRHSLSPQQEAFFWDDHLHMTPQGYNRMAEEVFKCLKPYIPNIQTIR